MKHVLLSIALLMCVAGVSAQETEKTPAKRPSIAGFVSNGFWDNWEISIGGGLTHSSLVGFLGKDDLGKWGKHNSWEANLALTKWIHPVFGVRAQVEAGNFQNSYYKSANAIDQEKWPFIFAHVDAMINFSNWVGGYRADRVYYAVPFAGFGYQAANYYGDAKDKYGRNQAFAFTAGLLNKFRLCKALDLNVEIKGWLFRSVDVPYTVTDKGNGKGANIGTYAQAYSATLGLTYRFNKREWQRGAAGYDDNDIKAFQAAVAAGATALAAAKAENAKLADDLDEAKKAAAAAKADADKAKADLAKAKATGNTVYMTGTAITFFTLNSARISDREKVRLDLIAEQIKNGPKDNVYTIEGHADAGTGNDHINDPLSARRAKAVKDYLVSKGVNPDQLKTNSYGAKNNPFKNNNSANRVVFIK